MSDIIGSRNKNQKLVIDNFKKCTGYINEKYEENILSPLTITLGDEFQGVINNLTSAVKILIDLEEFVILNNFDFKLRYVIFYGEIETQINHKVAYEMLGNGLTYARKLITKMKSDGARFLIDVGSSKENILLNNSFNIYQNIVDKWNIEKDFILISNLIKYRDYKIVSEIMKKERSLIWKREKNLNISSYNSVKEIILTITKL